jgi:hypothetical protein
MPIERFDKETRYAITALKSRGQTSFKRNLRIIFSLCELCASVVNLFYQKLPASNRYKFCSPVMLYSSTTVPSDK